MYLRIPDGAITNYSSSAMTPLLPPWGCMDTRYRSRRDAHTVAWLLTPWQYQLDSFPPLHGPSIALLPVFRTIQRVVRHVAFSTDALETYVKANMVTFNL